MLKNMTKIALLLIVGLASLAWYSVYDYNDTQRLDNLDVTPYTTTIYLNKTNDNSSTALQFFESLSKKYQLSVDKVTASSENGLLSKVYAGVFNPATYPLGQLQLIAGHFINNPDDIVASYATGSPHQVGSLFAFSATYPVKVLSLSSYYNQGGSVDGVYRLVSTQPINHDALQAVSEFFHIDEHTLLTPTVMQSVGMGALFPLSIFMIILLSIAFVLLALAYPVSIANDIGVKKMLGWSSGGIWKSILGIWPFIVAILAIVADGIAVLVLNAAYRPFIASLFGIQIGILVLFVGVSTISIAITHQLSVSNMLKGIYPMKLPLVCGFILKAFMIIITAVIVGVAGAPLQEVLRQHAAQSLWQAQGDLSVMTKPVLTTADAESMVSGNSQAMDPFASLYPLFNDTYHGIYVTSAKEDPDQAGNPGHYDMTVNPNYLARFPLCDTQGKEIVIPETETDRILLVPQSLAQSAPALAKQSLAIAQQGQALAQKNGESTQAPPQDIKTIIYKDDQPLFSFSLTAGADSGYLIKDPVISVITEKNSIFFELSNIAVGGIQSPMKLPLSPTQTTDLETYLAQHGFADYHLKFVTLANALAEQAAASNGALGLFGSIIAGLLIVSVVVDLFLAVVIIIARKKVMVVQRCLGYSLFTRYHREAAVFVVLYVVAVLIVLFQAHNLISLILMLCLFIFDIAAFLLIATIKERKSIHDQLQEA